MKNFLIVDGNSILNRAFYGIRPLTTHSGLQTNAVYGVITILQKHLEALKPDYCAIAFDMRAPTFRHLKFDGYKAARKGMPEELAVQLPYAKKCVDYMGFHVLEKEGYEADDILGTLSKQADEAGVIRSYILTGDKDSLQLISDTTNILLAKTKEDILFDKTKFKEEYGISPEQFVDVKALMGDTSDNIPGVPGIGEKTAFKLISDFGGLDEIYSDRSAHPVSASVSAKLDDGKDNAYLSRELATIFREVPCEVSIDDMEYHGFKKKELASLFTELEFSALIKRLGLDEDTEKFTSEMDISEVTAGEISDDALMKITGESVISLNMENKKLYILNENKLCCKNITESDEILKTFLNKDDISFIMYNYKQIYTCMKKLGYTVKCSFDIMLAAYVLSSNDGGFTLDRLCEKYLSKSVTDLNSEKECGIVYSIYKVMADEITKTGMAHLLYDIEIPLSSVLADMEEYGFKVDAEGLKKYSEMLKTVEEQLAERIYMSAGCSFNINSPKQLGEILFDKLGLPAGKKTKTGYSTGADILEKLRPHHPIIEDILDYRQVAKLRSTYGEGLLNVVDDTGRIHTSFNQTGTATGRLSSTDPNLQNIPVRQELGRELRKYFIAENDDYLLIDADYSQIELRLLAHISGDEVMINAFNENADIHTITASQVFNVPEEFVNSELRKRAKAVNFGIVYGIGDFSLAQDLGITKKQAADYISGYLETYKGVGRYLKDTIENARTTGYCTTMFGRRRYVPELNVSNKMTKAFGERVAMNSPIQGTAADIIKIAMINTARALKEADIDARLILQVHDELIIEAHRDCVEKASEILKTEMQNAVRLSVPLTADISSGKTWYESK